MNLSLREILHDYGRGPVLNEVSCEVPPGAFLAVIGPNGAAAPLQPPHLLLHVAVVGHRKLLKSPLNCWKN